MAKPFLQLKLRQNQDMLDKLRQLPVRAQRNIRRKIVTELLPWLEQRSHELMTQPWVAPSSPFKFGTPQSRLYYFWLIRHNPGLTDDHHWIRTMRLESSFRFEASDRLRGVQIKGGPTDPDSRYVFGPWLVAGHRNTGWPERVEQVRRILQAEMRHRLRRMWKEAVREARRGQG